MNILARMVLLGASLSGCKVVDAPENLEDLLVFGFVNLNNGTEYTVAAAEGLMPIALRRQEELSKGYRISPLTNDDILAVGLEPPEEVTIMGASTMVSMRSSVDELATVLTWPDMTEVQEPMIRWEIQHETDRACFLAHKCDSYLVEGERERDLGFLGKATQAFIREWVWVEVDEGIVLAQRELNPDPAEITSPLYQVDQQYAYSIFFPHKKGTKRLEAHWVDAVAIGVEIPDTFALDLTVQAVKSNAEELDAFVDENI